MTLPPVPDSPQSTEVKALIERDDALNKRVTALEARVTALEGAEPALPVMVIPIDSVLETALSNLKAGQAAILRGPNSDRVLQVV